jgi:hypothetical protein
MAFTSASGYNNLPNGNFSPTIFSQKAQLAFRKTAVCEDITNSSYFGEIANYGDSVRIMKEPEIQIRDYVRGKQITPQELADEDYTLTIDQAKEFAFQIDDIEAHQSHIDFMDLASDRAGYDLKDEYDSNVLGYMAGYELVSGTWTVRTSGPGTNSSDDAGTDEWLSDHKLDASDFGSGSGGDGIVLGVDGTYDATPLAVLNRFNRLMNSLSVPRDGRWVVMDPVFVEMLLDENSKLISADYGDEGLMNGRITSGKLRGFRLYESNNLPYIGTGPGTITTTAARSSANMGFILCGHDSAVATASQITKTESYRSQQTFADVVRGMQYFGRKILRPEALLRAGYNVNK